MVKEITIIREIIRSEVSIRLRSDNIVHVTFAENSTLDIKLQMQNVEDFITISQGKKLLFVFDAMEGVTITAEARDNSKKIEDRFPAIATAVVADSLPYKIIANFFLKINKPKIPYKVFTKFEDAEKWLKTFDV